MKKSIFSILDVKSHLYGDCFVSNNSATAQRSFADAVNEPRLPFSKHPEDYLLVRLGAFDDETGEIVQVEAEDLGLGFDYVAKETAPQS